MANLVSPKCYWVGYTEMNDAEMLRYLKDSGNDDFWRYVQDARDSGLTSAEILCSMFAKLCYKSLSEGKNANLTKVRGIEANIRASFDAGHGSVFEHVGFSFVIADCSRVFTHELVRHRIGTAFSQNSGRYIHLEDISLVFDPILEGCEDLVLEHLRATEKFVLEMEKRVGLRDADGAPNEQLDFARKKKLTSAIRRVAPNGQSNEIGFSVNLRSLRRTVMMRTGRHSEWEIRLVFQELYCMLKDKYPTIFHGAKEEVVDGIIEVSGMKMQPYEKEGAA